MDFKDPFLSNFKSIYIYRMARSRTRSRVKSRRNRRPSKARTRRVSKRRMGRVSKRRTRRVSKRGRRFQRGGMELTPAQQMMRQTIRPGLEPELEPEPTVESPNIFTNSGLPAVSVDKFNPLVDQSPERYSRLLLERANDYATSLKSTIEERIEKLQSDLERSKAHPRIAREIQAKIVRGEKYLKDKSPLFGIDDQIVFEFVDVRIEPNPTFSLGEGSPHDKTTRGENLSYYYSVRKPPPCFEIIVMINPLRYIVIRGTYDEILKLYPLIIRRFLKMRGDVETQSQTIFDNIVKYWQNGLIRATTHIRDNHPLKSLAMDEIINVDGHDLRVRPRDLLLSQINWVERQRILE